MKWVKEKQDNKSRMEIVSGNEKRVQRKKNK